MDTAQLAVVGAGVAGTAAAIEAARLGLDVTLVDEHPVDLSLIQKPEPSSNQTIVGIERILRTAVTKRV